MGFHEDREREERLVVKKNSEPAGKREEKTGESIYECRGCRVKQNSR